MEGLEIVSYKRETIYANIKTTLDGISTDNGYENDVRQVTRRFKAPDEVKEFPALCVIPSDTPMRHLSTNDFFEGELGFVIYGYVKEESDQDDSAGLSIALEGLIGDTIKALYSDIRRGNADFVDLTEITEVADYYDWTENIGLFIMTGHVTYTGTFTLP